VDMSPYPSGIAAHAQIPRILNPTYGKSWGQSIIAK